MSKFPTLASLLLLVAQTFAVAVVGALGEPAVTMGQDAPLALTGATILDATGGPAIENGVLLVQGEYLECVGGSEECPVPEDAKRVDLSGSFVTPGLVDAHVHFDQTGWLDARPEYIRAPDVYPYEGTIEALRADPDRWHRA